jgi:integrase
VNHWPQGRLYRVQALKVLPKPRLRAVIVAMLETACRPGEILSLQWKDVSLERSEIIITAEKAKTRTHDGAFDGNEECVSGALCSGS